MRSLIEARTADDDDRRSTSIQACCGMEFTESPPPIRDTVTVVRGVRGSVIVAMEDAAAAAACTAFATPNADHE